MKPTNDEKGTEETRDGLQVVSPAECHGESEPTATSKKAKKLKSLPRQARSLRSHPLKIAIIRPPAPPDVIVQEDLEEILLYEVELREAKARYERKRQELIARLRAGATVEHGIHRAAVYDELEMDGRKTSAE